MDAGGRRRGRGVICTVVGARPNFMKAAPVHAAFSRAGVAHEIVHTGQHYDAAMSHVFFDELNMPRPAADLGVGSGSHAEQTAAVMVGLERLFVARRPRAVLVVGDVNSTLAASLVAAKLGIFVGHIEAGLRSNDWAMPEEVNRVVTDSVADLLLTPSPDADRNLLAEGCAPESIARVGNVMIDTLMEHLPRARALDVPAQLGLPPDGYAVMTLHRPSNVDDPAVLRGILGAIARIAERLPVVFPVHPRTRKHIEALALTDSPGIRLTEPLGYLEFLSLTSRARLVMTDSGGLQEESTVLGIPCLTLRKNTERPITIEEGTNVLVGTDPEVIFAEADRALGQGESALRRVPALWDGQTAGRIVEAVMSRLGEIRMV
jgi:UDP-N-acetylglucosamine 2-epimerase (non-hydrolysing)